VLSKVFREVEAKKEEIEIEEYSLSQPTLEQVFIGFAKKQDMDDE